jgi:acyl-CoA synthetase (AMP-forming)/AMP-acid ligase II
MILAQSLTSVAVQNMTRPAFSFLGKEQTYHQLMERVGRLSYLYQHEMGHSPRVAFLGSNSPSIAASFFAITNLKGVVVPIPWELPPEEKEEIIRKTECTHVFTTTDFKTQVREFLSEARLNLPITDVERKQGGEYDTSFTAPQEHTPRDTDVVLILRTMGSKGEKKYVQFNHQQLVFAAQCLRKPYKIAPTDRVSTPLDWGLPFSFVHGMLMPMLLGATCVIDLGHKEAEYLKFLREHRVTKIALTPEECRKIIMTCRATQQTLPTVKAIAVGLGTLSVEFRKIFKLLETRILQVYGQTESAWTIGMEYMEEEQEDFPIYRPLPGVKYKVVDPNGDTIEIKDIRVGRLAVSSASIMHGYYLPDNEAAINMTRDVKRGTWLYTGDVVELDGEDEDLKMILLGREDDAMNKENQYYFPHELDAVVRKVKGLLDGAGFFTANRTGRTVAAVVAVKRKKSPLKESDILGPCKAATTPPVTPTVCFFTDSIPRDRGGNVLRWQLGKQYNGLA